MAITAIWQHAMSRVHKQSCGPRVMADICLLSRLAYIASKFRLDAKHTTTSPK